jgi:hypothetical protein
MARPFLETLRELRAGRTMDDLAENLAAIVTAVRATGKSGRLQLTLVVKPPKAGGASYLMVEDSILTKIPKLDHGDTVFFHTKDGGLSRQDPGQQELSFKAVPTEQVDTRTGEITVGAPA